MDDRSNAGTTRSVSPRARRACRRSSDSLVGIRWRERKPDAERPAVGASSAGQSRENATSAPMKLFRQDGEGVSTPPREAQCREAFTAGMEHA
jgi:hypothetical protein